ncbi:ABC transporter permease [Streptococcus ruminicola]|uniref:ABC transporter permease n=1 Tax=Streptococcus ruminicola TaxID=2686210 RepID=UPI001EE462BD|nr:ABC transporter permease [Streptococcus ruminicola]
MMLLKAVASWNRKKSLEEYRRYLLRLSYFILALAGLSLVLASLIRDNDFASGLMLGGGSAGLIFAIYYWLLSRQPKRLKDAYIALYDERNQYILRVTAVSTLIFMFLVNVMLIALYAFLGIAFSYVILLMIWLYCLLLGFLGLRIIFSKIL